MICYKKVVHVPYTPYRRFPSTVPLSFRPDLERNPKSLHAMLLLLGDPLPLYKGKHSQRLSVGHRSDGNVLVELKIWAHGSTK